RKTGLQEVDGDALILENQIRSVLPHPAAGGSGRAIAEAFKRKPVPGFEIRDAVLRGLTGAEDECIAHHPADQQVPARPGLKPVIIAPAPHPVLQRAGGGGDEFAALGKPDHRSPAAVSSSSASDRPTRNPAGAACCVVT